MAVVCYSVPSELTSPQWADAFAAGCGGEVCLRNELQPGAVAMFGSPARWGLLQQAMAEGREWIYGDHAYFGRREYYRATRGARQVDPRRGEGDAVRFERLGLEILPWQAGGEHILLCPNSPEFFRLNGLDADRWVAETKRALRRHTDRPIRVRYKTAPVPFEESLRGAWAVVVHTSICGAQAALAGVPCFATAECASQAFGSDDLSLIERPPRPADRYEMACVLAANQWSLAEYRAGMAWEHLNANEAVARLDPA